MYPILFTVGKVNVYTHGLMIVLGALIGGYLLYYLAKIRQLDTQFLFDLIIYSMLGGIIGARLLYVIIYYYQFASPLEMLYIWYGGLISYGGIAGGLLVAWLILKRKNQNIWQWFDIGIIGLLVGWAVGRIGCLLNGDSVGMIINSKIAIWGHLPTPIFESIWCLIVAGISYYLLKNKDKYVLPNGFIFWTSVGLYGLGRAVIDYFRDENSLLWILKSGQIGGLAILFIAIAMILILRGRGNTNANY